MVAIWACLFAGSARAGEKTALDLSADGFAAVQAGNWSQAYDSFRDSFGKATATGDNLLAAKSAFNEAVVAQRLVAPPDSASEWFQVARGTARRQEATARRVGDEVTTADIVKAARDAGDYAVQARDTPLAVKAVALGVSFDPDAMGDDEALRQLNTALDRAHGDAGSLIKITEASVTRFSHTGNRGFMATGYKAAAEAEKLSTASDDRRAMALSIGLMARLYSLDGRLADALALTGDALIWADQAGDVETELEMEIQRAALMEATGDNPGALYTYDRATQLVLLVRPFLAQRSASEAHSNLRGLIRAALFASADLMLRTDGDNPKTLIRVRSLLELNKVMDLENYFSEPCVRMGTDMIQDLQEVGPGVAVIYPVVLADRTEVIVGTQKDIRRYVSKTSGRDVARLAADYRAGLQPEGGMPGDVPSQAFMAASQALYNILVAPELEQLHQDGIRTLVFAPDAGLRGAPLSALSDGKAYVIESYAVATALGLSLVDPTPIDRHAPVALLAGLSEKPDDMDALVNVPDELTRIKKIIPRSTQLLNAEFTKGRLEAALQDTSPNIVHMATHTRFGSMPEKNGLLIHDGSMTPKQLGDLVNAYDGKRHLEILGLSACETAVEQDDDSLLGMAGAAYQSGARSVVGSMWKVSDDATAVLMPGFYENLIVKGESKAEAMRQAQLKLLRQDGTRHPFYWAAFIVLGNWL